jgi:hypothetical protein
LLILIDPTSRAEKLVLVLEAIAEFLDDEKVQQTDWADTACRFVAAASSAS